MRTCASADEQGFALSEQLRSLRDGPGRQGVTDEAIPYLMRAAAGLSSDTAADGSSRRMLRGMLQTLLARLHGAVTHVPDEV